VVSGVVQVTLAIVNGNTASFSALGGYGTKTYTLTTNVSGGSVNSSTGLYTAGSTPGTDVVTVTDSLGNVANATITVS
jgi:hypothetical protein